MITMGFTARSDSCVWKYYFCTMRTHSQISNNNGMGGPCILSNREDNV